MGIYGETIADMGEKTELKDNKTTFFNWKTRSFK